MKLVRLAAIGLLAGAVVAFVAALLRPRRLPNESSYDPARGQLW